MAFKMRQSSCEFTDQGSAHSIQCPTNLIGYLQCGRQESTKKERKTHRHRTDDPGPHGLVLISITAYGRNKDNSGVQHRTAGLIDLKTWRVDARTIMARMSSWLRIK